MLPDFCYGGESSRYSLNVISAKESRLHTGLTLSDNSIIDNRFYLNLGFNPSNSFSIYLYAGLSVYHNEWDSESKTDVIPAIQAYATFRPSGKFMARLSYQSTSSLPPMSTLSGYGSFIDSLAYQTGNPALSGQWKNSVELHLSFINRINLKAAFSNTTDAIFDIAGVGYGQDHPYVYYKYQNGTSRYCKFSADYNQPLPGGFMLAVSGSVTGSSAIYKDLRCSKWLPDADVTLTYRHEKSNFMAMFQYGVLNTLRNLTPQGRSYDIFDGFCFGAEKYFLKGRLSVNFTYILPIHLFRGEAHGRFDSPALVQRSWNDNYKRLDNKINVGIAYRFSNGQRVRKYNHSMYNLQ